MNLKQLAICAAILSGLSAFGAADYLSSEARARVKLLKAEVRQLPSNRANARHRALTLWDWINAYSLTGRYMPVHATLTASRVLAYPDRADYIGNLDAVVREFTFLDEQPDALGTLVADTGPFEAGTRVTVRQTYTVGNRNVVPGDGFGVAWHGMARFSQLQADDGAADDYVTISSSNPNVRFSPSSSRVGGDIAMRHAMSLLFRVVRGRLVAGDTVTITYGDTRQGGRGITLPHFASHRMPLPLYLHFADAGVLASLPIQPIVVTGSQVAGVHGFAPSVVATGESFALSVRAQDRFYNRATGPIPNWEVFVNGEPFAEIEAGNEPITVLNDIAFDEPGVYRFTFRSKDGAITGRANPVLVEHSPKRRIYWGDTHSHSGFADGIGTADELMVWAREDARLDFATHSEHDTALDDFEWNALADTVRRFSTEGEFVAFLGYEWTVKSTQGGHHNVLFRTPEGRRRIAIQEYSSLPLLHQGLHSHHDPQDVLVIPHAHQAADFRLHDPSLVSLVEIMSQQGAFEWFAQQYLRRGHPVGFIAASDNHLSRPGYTGAQRGTLAQRGGLAAVSAPAHTRDALFDALKSRSVYATTGDRIILDVALNGAEIGQRIPFAEVRRVEGRVVGTAPLDSIAVVRNGLEVWRQEYRQGAGGRAVDGDYELVFHSDSQPSHAGDNPRGWRWWRGRLDITGAVATAARGLDFHNAQTQSLELSGNGRRIAFRTHTRGNTSTIRLTLRDVDDAAKIRLTLREAREFGGGVPRHREHHLVPATEVEINLADLDGGVARRELPLDDYVDTVTLRRVANDGELDVAFAFEETRRTTGDYYFVRVQQANGAMAWSSPIWVGLP